MSRLSGQPALFLAPSPIGMGEGRGEGLYLPIVAPQRMPAVSKKQLETGVHVPAYEKHGNSELVVQPSRLRLFGKAPAPQESCMSASCGVISILELRLPGWRAQ